MDQCTIACALHDYLEIACLYHYRLKLTLRDRSTIEGIAKDIATLDQREYLILENDQRHQIELTTLKMLEVLTAKAQFRQVEF